MKKVHNESIVKATCEICSEGVNQIALEQHIMDNHGDKHVCDVCDKMFANEEAYELHRKLHRNGANQCMICNKIFAKISGLTRHEKESH